MVGLGTKAAAVRQSFGLPPNKPHLRAIQNPETDRRRSCSNNLRRSSPELTRTEPLHSCCTIVRGAPLLSVLLQAVSPQS